MKFVNSCMLASMAAFSSNPADISVILTIQETRLTNDPKFQKAFLKNLQKDPTNEESDCLTGYTLLQETYSSLVSNLESDADYLAGLAAKGQGSGSSYGYALDKFESYVDMATVSTNLFNECDLDYYLQALSKAVSNVAGFINQSINTFWRMQESTVFDEMETAFSVDDLDNTNYTRSAELLAQFVKDFLMAEIPDKAEAGYYVQVGSLM